MGAIFSTPGSRRYSYRGRWVNFNQLPCTTP